MKDTGLFHENKITELKLVSDLTKNYQQIKTEVLNLYNNNYNVLHDYPQYNIPGYDCLWEKYWKCAPYTQFEGEHVEIHGNSNVKYVWDDHNNRVIEGSDSSETYKKVLELTSLTKTICPTLYKVVEDGDKAGYFRNGFISVLKPGSILNPHFGWTQKFLRVHLGIQCDTECKITVGKRTQTWQEGKILAFCDGDTHSVKHLGTIPRIITSIDVNINWLRDQGIHIPLPGEKWFRGVRFA